MKTQSIKQSIGSNYLTSLYIYNKSHFLEVYSQETGP